MVEGGDYADGITKTPIVIDNGSGIIKAGFGGEEQPSLLFNSYVGRPKYDKVMVATTSDQNIFIGEQTEKFRGVLKINYPIEHGIITDWKDMELLWRHVYEKLNVSPKEHPVLLTEAPLNPYMNRVRAAEIFFETFDVPSLFFQTQAVLSLYAQGKTTGVVLDCGDGVCHCAPIYEGFSVDNAIRRIDVGGRDVTDHLMLLLRRAGYIFHTTAEFEIVKKIKERFCFVSPVTPGSNRADQSMQDDRIMTNYLLPDGQNIKLGAEKYKATEILFSPDKIGLEYPGIDEMVFNSIQNCDIDLRRSLYDSIITAGGSSLFHGFSDRLHRGISRLRPKDIKVTLIAPTNRKLSCWIGGATVTGLNTFNKFWVTKKDMDEEGSRILLNKGI